MKIIVQITASLVFMLLIAGCKKQSVAKSHDSMTFTYNGSKYVLSDQQQWGAGLTGITINRPDLFNGTINFLHTGCAYLNPVGQTLYTDQNCILIYPEPNPLDSSQVFIYKSGTLNIQHVNCRTESGIDIFTGTTGTVRAYDLKATFDLVLANKNNHLITLTAGEVNKYNVVF